MYEILHITAHMGGGVGKVLSGISCCAAKNKEKYKHKILLLEKPEKTHFVQICQNNGVEIVVLSDKNSIKEEMQKADIVQIEWWHHPKMAEFLHYFPKIPINIVIWCHISGCSYPALPFEFIKLPNLFLFTSKYSLENLLWNDTQKEYVKQHSDVVNSSGGFQQVQNKELKKHDEFNLGYVGTLSYSKLHPDFIEYCSSINIENVKFIMVGDAQNQESIKKEAKQKGILSKLKFVGYTENVASELERFDIFIYPLNPEHFGTTENALLEAMAIGLPVVALRQCAEKYLVKHMETGLLANNIEEFSNCIRYLYENPKERERLGQNAKKVILEQFSVENTIKKLHSNYEIVRKFPKRIFDFDPVFGERPYNWFLSCLGEVRKQFEDTINLDIQSNPEVLRKLENNIGKSKIILKGKSKGSICQYARYFPNDKYLNYWAKLIERGVDSDKNRNNR